VGSRVRAIVGATAGGAASGSEGGKALAAAGAAATAEGAPAVIGTGAAGGANGAVSATGVGSGAEVHHHASAPAMMPTATASRPREGPHAAVPAGSGSDRRGWSIGHGPAARQGAAGFEVEMPQPMRSCPYWFQIGLLPLVNAL
jgi:hypothetical protein